MKTFWGFLSLVLAVVLVAGPAFAATHKMTGDIKAIDPDAKTFTLSEHKMLRGQKEYTFSVNDSALLSNLRSGERVRVTYDKQGQRLLARDIRPMSAASTMK
jgi:Cu/Ag efflux protein CusF